MPYDRGVAIINGVKYIPYINGEKYTFPYYKEYDEHTLLLLHGDSLEDSSMYQVPITNNGVVVSSDQSKFGGKSLYFNGNSKLLLPHNTINFGNNNFTIDWWEYWIIQPTGTNGVRFSNMYTVDDVYGGMVLGYSSSDVYISSSINSDWDLVSGAKMLNVTLNQWVHWACIRDGNVLNTYRNGILFSTQALTGAIAYSSSAQMAIGDYRFYDPSYFIGYLDEFRISDVARWTSDFTPPTEPYSS